MYCLSFALPITIKVGIEVKFRKMSEYSAANLGMIEFTSRPSKEPFKIMERMVIVAMTPFSIRNILWLRISPFLLTTFKELEPDLDLMDCLSSLLLALLLVLMIFQVV